MMVTGHSPATATLNQATTFTYVGTGLAAGMAFTVTNCDTTTFLIVMVCAPVARGMQLKLRLVVLPPKSAVVSQLVTVKAIPAASPVPT